MRTLILTALAALTATVPWCQTDWPVYGHDPGGMRFSPLQQINTNNVAKLQLVWTYDTNVPPVPGQAPEARGGRRGSSNFSGARPTEATPLVVGDVMYLSTAYNRVLALDPEAGKEIWRYDSPGNPALRGIAYYPGNKQLPPQIVFGTRDGSLISLNAKTGRPVPGFGNEGIVNLRAGVADKFPNSPYGLSSPPAIYKDLVITGSQVQEAPGRGPAGDIRAWDIHTGKLVWTFHTVPRPGEPNHDSWEADQWLDRSGVNSWGLITVDIQQGMVFVPLGTPPSEYWGGDRKGSNLYGSSLVALAAATGKLKWHFQTTHHDNWDYDLSAPPALIEVTRNGRKTRAVAQITKQTLLFLFDRLTGKPIYDVEERPIVRDNPTPGDEGWATQPFPAKPPPLGRVSFKPEDLSTVTPEHAKFCKELLASEGGAMTGGPYAQYGPKLRVVFPGMLGGGNWGGTSFDPQLGYVFANVHNVAAFQKLVSPDGKQYSRRGPDNAPPRLANRFWEPETLWPCQQPPWGELSAVNVNTGDIAWRVPLGSFDELEAKGVPKTGAPNLGGSIATAGGLVFIGATIDTKFRAFDSKTGRELWVTKLEATAHSVPITYRGKSGKQYVAVTASGGGYTGDPIKPGKLYVFALP